MNNSEHGAKTLAQIEARMREAQELVEKANRDNYDWTGIIDRLVGWEPKLVAKRFRLIYFEYVELFLRDKNICGAWEELADALYDLRGLADALEKMEDSGERLLLFTTHPSVHHD